MSNQLRWQDKGLTHNATGVRNREYIIYLGDHITVVERISDPRMAREYLESRSGTTTFKNPNGRFARLHQREEAKRAKRRKHNGKTIVLHQRVVKTISAAKKLAQEWHDENV